MGVLLHYDDGNLLEDVTRQVINTSPKDRPLLAMLGKTKAKNVYHQWVEDELPAAAANAGIEGAAHSFGTVTAPVRRFNYCQILKQTYFVSRTEEVANGAGVSNMTAYQRSKKSEEIGNDWERVLVLGTLQSGNATEADQMAGMLNYCTTNATDFASGDLTEDAYGDLLQLSYDEGGSPDTTICAARVKRIISHWQGNPNVTINIDADVNTAVMKIDMYTSDFGDQKVILERYMPSGDGTNSLFAFEQKRMQVAIYDPIRDVPNVAQDSDGTKGVLRGQVSLEMLAEVTAAHGKNISNNFPS